MPDSRGLVLPWATVASIARRRCLAGLVLAGVAAVPAAAATHDNYPSAPVRIIVPFAAGGPVDLIGRILADQLTQRLGQTVFVENRGGAAGAIGSEAAANAKPDGYTLFMGTSSSLSVLPLIESKLKFDPEKDFVPINIVATGVQVLVVHPSIPAKTLPEFAAYANAQKTPVSAASGGYMTSFFLAMAERAAGMKLTFIPYKGTGQFMNDVIGGHVPFTSADVSVVLPMVRSGQLRALGIASPKRLPLAPEIPTFVEQGYKDFTMGGWMGLYAPAKVPANVRTRLEAVMKDMAADPKVDAAFRERGLLPLWLSGPAAVRYVQEENERYRSIVKSVGIQQFR